MAKQPQDKGQELGPALDILEVVTLGIGRFRWWILPFTALGLLVGCAVALIQVNRYVSSAMIWVEWSSTDAVSPNAQMGAEGSRQPSKKGWDVRTELQLLRTKALDEMIVREVGIERLTEPINPMQFDHAGTPPLTRWQHRAQDWWHNRNRKQKLPGEPSEPKLNIDSPKGLAAAVEKLGTIRILPGGENIINVRYSARSPELAQDVVAATTQALIARHVEIFSRGETEEYASTLIDRYGSQEEDAVNTLSTHQRDCGFFNIEQQEPIFRTKLTKIQDALSKIEDDLIEYTEELKRSTKELPSLPTKIIVTKPETRRDNPIYTETQQAILRLNTELASASATNKGARLVEVTERINKNIEQLETFLATLDKDMVAVKEHEVEEDNPDYIKLKDRIAQLELLIAQRNKLLSKSLKREADALLELERLENCRPTHADMRTEIISARSMLGDINKGQSQLELDKLMAQGGFKNIKVMEQPSYNPNKNAPDRGIVVLMGLAGGFFAGILFTMLRQLLDFKFRYPKSVASSLGVPVLGVIPEQRSWRRLGSKLRGARA